MRYIVHVSGNRIKGTLDYSELEKLLTAHGNQTKVTIKGREYDFEGVECVSFEAVGQGDDDHDYSTI